MPLFTHTMHWYTGIDNAIKNATPIRDINVGNDPLKFHFDAHRRLL